jgi:acyl dehydratase
LGGGADVIAQSVVGRVLCDHVVEVSRAQLQLFAKAIGDALPEHVDAEAARTAGSPTSSCLPRGCAGWS